jgi:5-methylthioadenosine/S-adenosylhomocysteine deaminase
LNSPRTVDLRIDAHWIVPVEPSGVLTGHAVIVDDGRIVAVLPAADAEASYAPRETRTLASHVLIPGLVNAHTHTAMTLLRGIADDVPLKPWLQQHIWPREGRFVSAEFVFDGTLLGAAEMLRGGITCCNDMYFYPDAAARAYEIAGMRALLGMPVLDFPTPYAADADAYLTRGLAARDAFSTRVFCLASHWRRMLLTVTTRPEQGIVMYAPARFADSNASAETRAEVATRCLRRASRRWRGSTVWVRRVPISSRFTRCMSRKRTLRCWRGKAAMSSIARRRT